MTYKAKKGTTIPDRFVPQFWVACDQRASIVREIRHRVETLKEDTGADSYQKELLCQRAVFLTIQLETMEVKAAETGEFDAGVYTQGVNALSGLLSKLGLDKAVAQTVDLKSYMKGKR